LYTNGTGQYTGVNALNAYKQEFDPNAGFVPVELDGGVGTADGHWDETWAGGTSDLMTGYIEGATTFSLTTLYSFVDLGYVVDPNSSYLTNNTPDQTGQEINPVPEPSAIALLGIGLLGLARFRNRKTSI
jgi:hypothetical protein